MRDAALIPIASLVLAAACTLAHPPPQIGCGFDPREVGCPVWVPDSGTTDGAGDAAGDAAVVSDGNTDDGDAFSDASSPLSTDATAEAAADALAD